MVPQKHGPLAVLRNRRRLIEDIDDRKAILHLQGHEHARHEREMEIHVALIPVAKVGHRIFRPLVSLGQSMRPGNFSSTCARSSFGDRRASPEDFRSSCLRARKDREWRRDAGRLHPCLTKSRNLFDGFVDGRVIEVQVGLVRVKAMPVIRLGDRVPRPIRGFEILEDDSRFLVLIRCFAPDVEVPIIGRSARFGTRSAPRQRRAENQGC